MIPKVVAVVVNWNGADEVLSCVNRLRESDYSNLESIVVDNGSNEQDVMKLRSAFVDGSVLFVRANHGFGSGANRGIDEARRRGAEFVWLVNPDASVEERTLGTMVAVMAERPRVAAVGAVFHSKSGEQKARVWGGGSVNLWTGRTRVFREAVDDRRLDYVTGACLLLRVTALSAVGDFDERFFMYWEDTDLCFRLSRAGYELAVAPNAVVTHEESTSTGGRWNAKAYSMYTRSAVRFFRKHAPVPGIPVLVRTIAGVVKWGLMGDRPRLSAILKAIRMPVDARELADGDGEPNPMVNVVIPVHNGARFIPDAISSALEQDYPSLKVTVMDNASTDSTRELVRSCSDSRVDLMEFDEFVPVGGSWARALAHARGDYCMLLPCDDILLPGAISNLVGAAEAHRASAAVFGRMRFQVDEAGYGSLGRPSIGPAPGPVGNLERYVLQNGFNVSIGAVLFRRAAPGLRIDPGSKNACDLDVFLRLGRNGGGGFVVDADVVVTREHPGALSSNRSLMAQTTLETLAAHGTVSNVPRLYRKRSVRVLLWSVIDLSEGGDVDGARAMLAKYGKDVSPGWRLAMEVARRTSWIRRALLAVRTIRASWLTGAPVVRG